MDLNVKKDKDKVSVSAKTPRGATIKASTQGKISKGGNIVVKFRRKPPPDSKVELKVGKRKFDLTLSEVDNP